MKTTQKQVDLVIGLKQLSLEYFLQALGRLFYQLAYFCNISHRSRYLLNGIIRDTKESEG